MISFEQARIYTDGLESIPGFPRDDTARTYIARHIVAECPTEDAADRLVFHMTGAYHYWPGIGELIACAQRLNQQPAALPEWKPPVKPNDLCPHCASMGYVAVRDGAGGFVRCPACRNGAELPELILEMLNQPGPGPDQSIEARVRKTVEVDRALKASEYTGGRGA